MFWKKQTPKPVSVLATRAVPAIDLLTRMYGVPIVTLHRQQWYVHEVANHKKFGLCLLLEPYVTGARPNFNNCENWTPCTEEDLATILWTLVNLAH